MTQLQVTVDGSRILLAGELDVQTAPQLLDDAGGACADGPVVVDCAGLTFLDSTGLGALVALRKRCEAAGGTLGLVDVPGRIELVLRISGLDGLLLG